MWCPDVDAYKPQFREAIKEIIGEDRYYRQADIDLLETEDKVPWVPDNYILKLAPNAHNIPISLIDEGTDLDQVLEDLMKAGNIGLVLMGDQIGPRKRPAMIVMITFENLYALDPDFQEGIDFLKSCLQIDGLNFWTTNGLQEACCLLKQFNISLKGSNAKDCLGLHLHMMKLLAYARERQEPDTSFYPMKALRHAKYQKQCLVSFERLIYIWLDVDNNRELEADPSKYRHLSQRPLNQTAQNLIRKRCSLVLRLADKLDSFATSELGRINHNVMHCLTNVIDDTARKRVRKYLTDCEKLRTPPKVYFQHLDAIHKIDRCKLANNFRS